MVLADIEEGALDEAVARVRALGAEAIGVRTDVSKAEDVQALAEKARAEFGSIDVACNNAGVFTGGYCINPATGGRMPICVATLAFSAALAISRRWRCPPLRLAPPSMS